VVEREGPPQQHGVSKKGFDTPARFPLRENPGCFKGVLNEGFSHGIPWRGFKIPWANPISPGISEVFWGPKQFSKPENMKCVYPQDGPSKAKPHNSPRWVVI